MFMGRAWLLSALEILIKDEKGDVLGGRILVVAVGASIMEQRDNHAICNDVHIPDDKQQSENPG